MAFAAVNAARDQQGELTMSGNRSLRVLAFVAAVFLLDWGQPFFVPLCVSLLIAMALSPVVDALTLVVRWRPVAAALVVLSLVGLTGIAIYAWSDDIQAMWEEIPAAAKSISKSLQKVVQSPAGPITEMKKAAADFESVAQTGKPAPPAAAQPAPQPPASIPIWQVLWTGWKGAMVAAGQIMVVLFLVFFVLASGDLFKRKVLAIAAERNKTRFTLKMLEEIDAQVRRYLVVLLVANVLVGLGTWLAFLALGMKYAALWGAMAGVLHTAPYFGPTVIAGGSLLSAFVQFGEWPRAFVVAGSSILVATLVGQLFATWLASRQARMNTTATFIGLLFFAWIWGFWGILLGIPLLAIVKTVCDHNEDWKPVAELLGR
jgi:predicted PurR-regulated permease PerM